ncbi:MAG: family 20 glycosylhydrolase [Planctomycetes bacterium]|nr:family 20 glycosylhydrolase [Planctomycetota bacterium]
MRSTETIAILLAALGMVAAWSAGCAPAAQGGNTARYARPWRGVHVMVGNAAAARALEAEVPRLAAVGINAIVAEVNYGFDYQSHPELRRGDPITREQARSLAATCRAHGVRLIPQFQCLGHQSWKKSTGPLLTKHPEFDETPGQFPDNKDIYCRSWCPLHPQVNALVFDLFDELIDAFEADALHVGMDEVFLIGSEHCPRCRGRDPAELFARAVNDYHAHLVGKRKVEMMMWGDRLLDAAATGYGKWSASANGTHAAIDAVPKDIILCDWHYDKRDDYPSIRIIQEKGFRVWPSGWKDVEATEALIDCARRNDTGGIVGHLCTTWGAVKTKDLADWPPVRAAMAQLGGTSAAEDTP